MDMDVRNLHMKDSGDKDSLDSQDMELDKLLMGENLMELHQETLKDVRQVDGKFGHNANSEIVQPNVIL